jgi:hypothetical protein
MESTVEYLDPFVMRPRRPGDGVLARVFGASLDASLAAGCPPESSRLLAARARDIVSLRRRRSMADSWEHVLRVARRAQGAGHTGSRAAAVTVPVCADRLVAAEPAIRDLMSRLAAPLPVPARGVAMARVLLTDATSPVYNRRAGVTLGDAVAAAAAELDPALPLLTSVRR